MTPLSVLTRDDLIRAGACFEGVRDWIAQHCPAETALSVEQALSLVGSHRERRGLILRAAQLDGDGDGYGYEK